MLLYETTEGACSDQNLNKTQKHGPGYYCPIWDQAPGQCLTMERWKVRIDNLSLYYTFS